MSFWANNRGGAATTSPNTRGLDESGSDANRSIGDLTTGELMLVSASTIDSTKNIYGYKHFSVTAVKTSTYTADYGELVRCDPSGGGFTVNLPTAVGFDGYQIAVVNVTDSLNAITIDGNSSETIIGSATYPITLARGSACLVSDGANWMLV